ncbi:type 1 fimbrial protein [Enterobacteriaceae bacterium EKM102V]|uniref:fimbrial protein n=1 Tax=Pantoea TaxID=53335 RepID=UPI00142DCF69|nr:MULTISPECIES: fimbrial protein [Pantoea]KAF6660649.1 type 1 fimbrial protein [Enterobacteriaceae bacterium EKM102V]KAF6669512.1 type 1 fimbrial protein [Pantoea sp. EKM103V]
MKRKVLFIAAGGLLALTATEAQAYSCETLTMSTVLTPAALTIPRDLPVGSSIGSELVSGVVQTFKCSNTPAPALTYQEFGVKAYGNYVTSINGQRVYSTNVAGVGYALGGTVLVSCPGRTKFVDGNDTMDGNSDNKKICAVNGLFDGGNTITAQARIQFYKTARSTGTGTVSARNVGAFILRNDQSGWQNPESAISIAAFNVTSTARSVSQSVISVPMGTVDRRAFGGTGTWPGDANTRRFTIPLNCNAGTRVNVQIDGSIQNAARGVLNLNGGTGSASGVGIQLLFGDSGGAVQFGRPISTGTAASEGAYSIPFRARYYQTGSDVTPGTADASATFTLTYR